ncbi:peptide chain release factor N(5)-glutamine methyltransferase [Kozakia baliensis]|uniref:peptide chain release factor N(5)-glutamine methyltransferase n=1 Tax=Kozakia baliensis TaxID=153496 RepID=UPI0004976FFC
MSGKDHSLRMVLQDASMRLAAAGIEEARAEARILMAWALETDGAGLLLIDNISEGMLARFDAGLARRAMREPMALILGHTGFWTLDLAVSAETLVPRGDTESLIESLLAACPSRDEALKILDLGTGTGCLLLAALSEYSNAFGVGVDLAPQATALARGNAERNGLAERSAFVAGNWADSLTETFDVVLSNPPYIEHAHIAGLMPEVSQYEPGRALDGGEDGLDAYRVIVARLPSLLSLQGVAILELGQGQGPAVSELAARVGLRTMERRCDLGGIERALVLKREER